MFRSEEKQKDWEAAYICDPMGGEGRKRKGWPVLNEDFVPSYVGLKHEPWKYKKDTAMAADP